MDGFEYDLITEMLRMLVVAGAPVLGVGLLAGLGAGVLQAATTIRDDVIGYALKVLAVFLILYILASAIIQGLMSLAQMAFS